MEEQLSIQLVDSFFLIDPGETAQGGFKIKVRNEVNRRVRVK